MQNKATKYKCKVEQAKCEVAVGMWCLKLTVSNSIRDYSHIGIAVERNGRAENTRTMNGVKSREAIKKG